MRKTTLVLIAAAALAAAANPALAHCGGSHGKSHRAAQSKKPAANKVAVAKTTKPEAPAPLEATTGTGTEAVIATGPTADGTSFQF
jgi:hypothetical protein